MLFEVFVEQGLCERGVLKLWSGGCTDRQRAALDSVPAVRWKSRRDSSLPSPAAHCHPAAAVLTCINDWCSRVLSEVKRVRAADTVCRLWH